MSSFTNVCAKFALGAVASLLFTSQASACWFGDCFSGAPRTTYYAPVAPVAPCSTCSACNSCGYAPTCSTCGYAPVATTVGYQPYVAYRPTLFGGWRPYTAGYAPYAYSAGYAPYTAAYAPAYTAGYVPYTSYTAAYAPTYTSYMPYASYYAPTTVLSPSCGCSSCGCSSCGSSCPSCSSGTCSSCASGGCSSGTCSSCNSTFAPSSATPTTYIQSAPASSGCSNCSASTPVTSNDTRYWNTPSTTSGPTTATFSSTNQGSQFAASPSNASSDSRNIQKPVSVQQQPISDEGNRTEAKKSSVQSPLTPGREFDPENKTTLMPIAPMRDQRLAELPRNPNVTNAAYIKEAASQFTTSSDGWGK